MKILAKHSYYVIDEVEDLPDQINWTLGKWNPNYFRYDPIGYFYDEDKGELRIPRGFNEHALKRIFPDHKFEIDYNCIKADKVEMGLTAPPRDYQQKYILSFMLGKGQYEYTNKHSQLFIDLDTGSGKTYCGIASICYRREKSVIFTPMSVSKISKQWLQSAHDFTDMEDDEVLIVQGSKMCEKILEGKYDNVKIFIFLRGTVKALVRKYGTWKIFEDIIDRIKPGSKIIDEAHMDFSTIVDIDCHVNTKRTFYLSSSPARSDKDEQKIYKALFHAIPRHGKELKSKKQNHINTVIVQFESEPTPRQLKSIKTRQGPSQAKYGDYLLDEEGAREEFLDAYNFAFFLLGRCRSKGGKYLIICITRRFADDLAEYTRKLFPHMSVGIYMGSGKAKEKELEKDIVFATPKGMGTGSEFDNHQFTINTITYSSNVSADQLPGRNRKYEGRKSIYVELVNKSHKIAMDHFKARKNTLMNKSIDGKIVTHVVSMDDVTMVDEFFDKDSRWSPEGLLIEGNNYVISRDKKKDKKK